MKNILKAILVLIIIFSFANCKKESNERYVSSSDGLFLRKQPDQKSDKIDLIPYKEKVIIIEKDSRNVTINNINGNWVKVNWNNKIGWAFDGFLKEKLPINILKFFIVNVINFPQQEKNAIYDNVVYQAFQKSYPPKNNNSTENGSWLDLKEDEKNFPADLNHFEIEPYLKPNDEMIVINNSGVVIDKVKSLFFSRGEHGPMLLFSLNEIDFNGNKNVYIKKSDFIKVSDELPKINKIKLIENKELLEKYSNDVLLKNKDTHLGNIVSEKNYFKSLFEIKFNSDNIIHIIQFKHKAEDYYDFQAIYQNGNRLLNQYLNESNLYHERTLLSFSINGTNYLLVYSWHPHSGTHGNILYLIEKSKLIGIEAECSFCD